MSIDRRDRTAFEELADLYAEARPGYPDALVEDVIRFSGIPAGGNILEVGCGPGNATLPVGAVSVRRCPRAEALDTDTYLKLLRTYSPHRNLDDATRARLYAGIRAVLEQAGGQVTRPLLLVLFLAQTRH